MVMRPAIGSQPRRLFGYSRGADLTYSRACAYFAAGPGKASAGTPAMALPASARLAGVPLLRPPLA